MTSMNLRNQIFSKATERDTSGRMSRRQLLRMTSGLGLGAVGAVAFNRIAAAAPRDEHTSHGRFQEGGTPPAIATPEIGPRADGTTLWRVKVGGMDMENKLDLQAFFPSEITINAGDSIWFEWGMMPGFHTVTFPSGTEPFPLVIPDPEAGTPAADAPPKMILNPAFLFPSGGVIYDGANVVHSGADILADPTKPFIVTFAAAGSFDYLCIPHGAVMQAKVIVQEAGSELPFDQAAYDQMAVDQTTALIDEGKAEIAKYSTPKQTMRDDGTILWELAAGAGPGQVRVMAFLPESIEITVGDTIKWINQSPGEPHTVSFIGAGEAPPEDTIIEIFADGTPKFVQSNETLLPQGGSVWSGTGWVNSGFLGLADLGLPSEWECTFDTPGEFISFCVLHGDAQGENMAATITVNPKA